MLFELNDKDVYDIDLDYFNLNKNDIKNYNFINNNYDNMYDYNKLSSYENKKNNIDVENGYYLGNMFVDSYNPYKNYKPKRVNAYSEQQKMLLRIYELDFMLNDLNLYLDVNPKDNRVFEMFKKCSKELDMLKKKYYEKYQVLELCYDTKNRYTWLDNPWPWDGGYYV